MVKAMCCNCEYFSFRDQTFLGMPLLEINNDFQQHSGFYWHFLSDSPVTVTLSPHSMTHSAAEWLLSCRELRVVWCVVLASLPSPSMLGNAGLRSVVIHAVTSSSVPVSSFLSVKSCTSPGLLRLKPTALVSLVMAEPVQQWNWPQVFFFLLLPLSWNFSSCFEMTLYRDDELNSYFTHIVTHYKEEGR